VTNLIDLRRKLRERFLREGILQPRGTISPSAQEAFLQKLMKTLEENLAEEDLGVERLSQLLHMSRRQLHRKIRALNGQSPTDLIRTVRLQHARKMLEERKGTVSEVAYAVGFNNLSYFAKSFRQEFGKTPSEFSRK
jgi:AraC-like DNA-binding protein